MILRDNKGRFVEGHIKPKEFIIKTSNKNKGKIPWNKNKKGYHQQNPRRRMEPTLFQCDNCKKDLLLLPYMFKRSNHHFCNKKCQGEWQSINIIGENNPFYGKSPWNKDIPMREESKIKMIKSKENKPLAPIKHTTPEIIVQSELTKSGVAFKTHVGLKGHPDIFIEPNICVFVDGDYFHANPSKYGKNDLVGYNSKRRPRQPAHKIWEKDNKITEYLRNQGYIVIRLWEHDIHNSINSCMSKILNTNKHIKGR